MARSSIVSSIRFELHQDLVHHLGTKDANNRYVETQAKHLNDSLSHKGHKIFKSKRQVIEIDCKVTLIFEGQQTLQVES